MDAEIVFTGLCSILNPDGKNKKMGEPAVILVQTDDGPHGEHEREGEHERDAEHGRDPEHEHEHEHDHEREHGHAHEPHVAFLAFDSSKVEATGASFSPVDKAEPFLYVALAGVELVIDGNPPATPAVEDSYRELVAHRDDYWPEVIGEFDPAYVPPAGKRPRKTAVKAWMRFGRGRISASRVSEVPWRFTKGDGSTHERYFAEEVVYSAFPYSRGELVIRGKDLENDTEVGVLRFRKKEGSNGPLTLIIGNSPESDMAHDVEREPTTHVANPDADHFKFLNRVAGAHHGDGPKPHVVNRPPSPGAPVAGGGSAACGPGSGNGR